MRYVLGPNTARGLKRLLRGAGEFSRRDGLSSGSVFDDDFVDPFTVKWAASAGDGGSWIIWLPDTELVSVNGSAVNPAANLTAVGGEYPSGWYLVPEDALSGSDGGKLYLNITKSSSDDSAYTCAFSAEPTTDADSYAVPICSASVADGGERAVKQLATSVIVIGGGSGGATVNDGAFKFSAGTETAKVFSANQATETNITFAAEYLARSAAAQNPSVEYDNGTLTVKYPPSVLSITGGNATLSNNALVIPLTISFQDGTNTTCNISIPTEEQTVVVSSSYNATTHKFSNTLKTVTVLKVETPTPAMADVFEATPHSDCVSGS